MINCLAYVDLNPIRAGICERPEDYRWCSLGYHVQTENDDDFLSLDLGLEEFGVSKGIERLRRYREYVYEKGGISGVGRERSKGFEISRVDRFRYRTRYFTDSGIIGTKVFVYKYYQAFKDRFSSKHEKIDRKSVV